MGAGFCSRGRCGEALSYRRVTRLVGVAAGGCIPSRLRSFVEGGAGRGAAEKSLVSVSLGSVDLTRSSQKASLNLSRWFTNL